MVIGDGALAVQRGGDGDYQPLRQLDYLGRRTRGGDAAPGHDGRPPGRLQRPGRFTHSVQVRLGPKGRVAGELFLDDQAQVGLVFDHAAVTAPEP